MESRSGIVSEFENGYGRKEMSDKSFKLLSTFIYRELGIKMPPVKKIMLQSRLQKRLCTLKLNSFDEYTSLVFSKEGQAAELIHMIDLVTTNKTDFYREPAHFDILTNSVLNEIMSENKKKGRISVWSAGCSSGEEPFTLAIVLEEFLKNKDVDFDILATDLSYRILQKASLAIYPENRIDMIPLETRKKYFLRGRDKQEKTVRIVPELRSKVNFQRLNLMDSNYFISKEFDIIFCRNVLIYFDRETQEKVINNLITKLRNGGYFFLGHSESISSMKVPLSQIKPTVFKKI